MPRSHMSLTLDDAKRMLQAGEAVAAKIGIAYNIAIVDAGGNLVAFARQDGALIGSIDLAIGKAVTARIFDKPTSLLAEVAQPGAPLFGIQETNSGRVVSSAAAYTWLQERRRCWQGCDEVWISWFRTQEKVMSNKPTDTNIVASLDRRDVLRAGATIGGVAATALAMSVPAFAQSTGGPSPGGRDNGPLGARLQGVQHFGVTVDNMDRSFEFYTEVLGANEVYRDGDFHGDRIQNTLMTDQEIIARERGINPRTIGVPDLRGGEQRLDVRLVQFDNVVLELLHYRDARQPIGSGNSWAEPRDHMSPAYPRSMHICFYIRDDVDFNKFIHDLEAEAARRGMTQVKANRVIAVTTEQERQAAPMEAHTNKATQGPSNGWAIMYCKGPDGEQLEFVQALNPVKQKLIDAQEVRRGILARGNQP